MKNTPQVLQQYSKGTRKKLVWKERYSKYTYKYTYGSKCLKQFTNEASRRRVTVYMHTHAKMQRNPKKCEISWVFRVSEVFPPFESPPNGFWGTPHKCRISVKFSGDLLFFSSGFVSSEGEISEAQIL